MKPGEPFIHTAYTAPRGWTYGAHEIGNTLFLLPTAWFNILLEPFLAGRISADLVARLQQFIVSFQASLYSAITATAFYGTLRSGFAQTPLQSLLATGTLAFTTFFWLYARNLYDGVLCATLLMLSFWLLVLYKRQPSTLKLVIIYMLLGFGIITRLSMLLPIVATSFYVALVHRRAPLRILRAAAIAALTLVPFALWQAWYNGLRTGLLHKSPVQMPVYAHNNGLDGNFWEGATGLLLSPGKSIFVYMPLLLLALLLLGKFYRDFPLEGIYILLLAVPWFLLHANLQSWYGAWGWGPRHFVTVLPIFILPLAVNLPYFWARSRWRWPTLMLGLWGFVLAIAALISNWHFRMVLARQEGRLREELFVWSWHQSQAIDMLRAAGGNIVRMMTGGPPITIAAEYSEANEYVSSTLNLWPNALIAAGVPWYAAIAATLPLWLLLMGSGWVWYHHYSGLGARGSRQLPPEQA